MEELNSQSSFDRSLDITTNPPEGLPDGIYTYPDSDALYKKENGEWLKKIGDSDYLPLISGNKQSRIDQLELKATPYSPKKQKEIPTEYDLANQGDTDYSKYKNINNEWYSGSGEIFTDYPGKEGKGYRFENGKWYEYSSTIPGSNGDISQLNNPIKDPLRINALNKYYKKQGGPEKDVLVGYPGKEENQYKVQNGKWLRKTPENDTWVTITNEDSIKSLNNYFKKDISLLSDESEISKLKTDNAYSLNFNNNLKNINANFIGKEEEEVVKKLRQLFPANNGWKFDETGWGDRLKITAPNGQSETFVLDNWSFEDDKFNANNMIGWMQSNNLTPSEKEIFDRYDKLTSEPDRKIDITAGGAFDITPTNLTPEYIQKKARQEWLPLKSQKIKDIYDQYSEYVSSGKEGNASLSKSEIQRAQSALGALANDKETILQVDRYQSDIKQNIKSYKEKINQSELYLSTLNEKYKNGEIDYDQYKSEYSSIESSLINQKNEINNQINVSDNLVNSVNKSIGENYLAQELKGSFGGAMTLSAIKGFFSPARLLLGAAGEDMSAEKYHEFIKELVSPIWDYQTSLQYLRSQENPDLYQAAFSVAESLGAMAPLALSGGTTLLGEGLLARGTMGAVAFYPMSYYEMKDELEGIDIPESDKVALSSIYGIVSSAFESIGMEYAMGKVNTKLGSSIKRSILKNVLSKTLPKNASKEYIEALVRTETKAYVASLGLDLAAASGVEGLTEGLQSTAGAGIKELYDIGKGTKFFNNEGFAGVVKNSLHEGYLGALGGGMVHSVYIASDAINRGARLNNNTTKLLMMAAKTSGISEAVMTNLKSDLLNGRITKDEAKEIVNNFNIVRGNLNQMPENLTDEAKSVSLSLMLERDRLNKEIEGKDPNLVKPQSDRITEINNSLQELSKQNAVQEPSTEGVLQREQEGVTETGGERGGMEQVVQGEEVTREGKTKTVQEEVVPGAKAKVADVDIVYPTQPQAEERKAFRSTSEYVENASKELQVEDVEALSKELNGEFGLLTAENPMAQPLTEEENKQLNKKAEEWLTSRGYTPRRVTGKYGQAENSFFVPNLTRQDAIEFAKQFNQEAVAHSDGLVYQDGSMNPRVKENDNLSFTESYSPESDFVSVVNTKDGLKTFSIGYNFDEKVMPEQQAVAQKPMTGTVVSGTSKEIDDISSRIPNKRMSKIISNAAKSILNIIPNTKIIVHDTDESFSSATGVNDSAGFYSNGEIHINLNKANPRTVAHEVFHAVLLNSVKTDERAAVVTKKMIDAVSPKLAKNPTVKKYLDDFASNYEENIKDEEKLAELVGILAEQYNSFPTSIKDIIKRWLDSVAKIVGINQINNNEVYDVLNTIAKKVSIGNEITESDLNIIKSIDEGTLFDNEYVHTNGFVVNKPSGRKSIVTNTVIKESDLIDPKTLSGKPLEIVYYDNFTSSPYKVKNRVSGSEVTRQGEGGPGFSYREDIKKAGVIAAFTTVTKGLNLIDGIISRNKIAGQPAVIGVALQNKETGHLGNKTTARDFYDPKDGAIVTAVNDGIITENEAVEMLKGAVSAYEATKKGKDSKSSLGFSSNDFNSISEFFDKIYSISFERRGTFNSTVIPSKSDLKTNKSTKPYITKWLESGIPTLNEYYDETSEPYTKNAEPHDIVKYLNPNLNKIGISSSVKVSDAEIARAKKMGVEVVTIDDNIAHTSYPVVLFGENVGIPSTFNSVREMAEEWDVPNPFFKAGRRSNKATPVKIGELGDTGKKPSPRKQKVLPESVEKRLTEDGKGNYVFHHYSRQNRDTIKPTTGDGSFIVSKDEASALASVNGVAQYYAMADQKEQGTGNVQHTVLVPMNEVYYLQEDKLNLYDKAKEEFQKARPGQAFNPNYQAAWIGKVANDMGYKMLVSEWRNGELRAQTTLELKPEAENIEMKPRENITFNVGDKVNVFGEDAVITEVNGDIVSYKGDRSSGSLNVVRSKQSIRKITSARFQKQSKEDAIQDAKDKYELSVEKRGKDHKTGVTAAIADLQKSDWYRDSNDTQREEAIREIKKFFGEKLKAAPSVSKVMGKTKQTAFVSDLAAAIRDQVKLQARSSRETAKDINDRRKALGESIKQVVKSYKGKITEKQLNAINRRIASVNLFNQEMVERVVDYVNKVMSNAEYAGKVNNAFAERRAIRRMMKSGNMTETVAVAREFVQIDPSMVDDIDTYLEMAAQIRGAVKSSKRVKDSVSLKQIVNFGEAYEYIKPTLERQEEMMKNMRLAEYNDLVDSGVISRDMTLKEINKIINTIRNNADAEIKADEEAAAMDFLKDKLGYIKTLLRISPLKGYNPVTGEQIEISERHSNMINNIIKSNLDDLSLKQMIEMVDSLNNFYENGAVGGLEAAYETILGEQNAKSLEKKGIVARPLKMYFNKKLGQIFGTELTSLNELFNRMFVGAKRGIEVMAKSGFSDIIIGANKARRQIKEIQDRYVKEFGKTKNFFQIENVYERGAFAFLSRNLIGNDAEVKSEFNRRVDLLLESVEALKNGTAKEQEMAKIYEKVLDKMDVKSRDLNTIAGKMESFNQEATQWWINEWSKHYSDLSDVSRSVYNTILGKDINYTPDRYKSTTEGSKLGIDDNIVERNSAFLINTDSITDTNESGVMIASVRPKVLPKGRYVSLDFDMNNVDSLTGALVDINTAGAIRRLDSFFKSKSFKAIVPTIEDRKILTERVNKYIRRSKNKLSVPNDVFRNIDNALNTVSSVGTALGLGGVLQSVKQTVSVAISTAIQTGTSFNIYAGEEFNNWLNTTGASVTNRGQESLTAIESTNKKLKSFNGTFDKAIDTYKNLTQWQLKLFLSRPDVFVARAAFKSYYEQYLKSRGYDVSKINWSTWNETIKEEGIKELNDAAIIYADTMVSRQQNVSDERLAGELLASEDSARKLIRKVLLPFASFSINQRARLVADINALFLNWNNISPEDKAIAIKSIAGTTAEQGVFQMINFGIGMALYWVAQLITGHDDDDEEWKKRMINATKYPLRSLLADMTSPNPLADDAVIFGADELLAMFGSPSEGEIKQAIKDEEKLREMIGKNPMTESQINKFKEQYIKENTYQLTYNFTNSEEGKYGMFSIAADQYLKLAENSEMATNGTFTDDYMGKQTTKYLTDKDKSLAKSVFYGLEVPYTTGAALKEMGQVANKTYSIIKKRALTENQYDTYRKFKKEFKREPQDWEIKMIKSTNSSNKAINELGFIQYMGGLSPKQGEEYLKVFKKFGENGLDEDDYKMIVKNKSADYIIKKALK
jgi:hypothetical protein